MDWDEITEKLGWIGRSKGETKLGWVLGRNSGETELG